MNEQLLSDGNYKCDNCRLSCRHDGGYKCSCFPLEDTKIIQITKRNCVYIYCFNCWFKYKKRLE